MLVVMLVFLVIVFVRVAVAMLMLMLMCHIFAIFLLFLAAKVRIVSCNLVAKNSY